MSKINLKTFNIFWDHVMSGDDGFYLDIAIADLNMHIFSSNISYIPVATGSPGTSMDFYVDLGLWDKVDTGPDEATYTETSLSNLLRSRFDGDLVERDAYVYKVSPFAALTVNEMINLPAYREEFASYKGTLVVRMRLVPNGYTPGVSDLSCILRYGGI